MRNAEIWYDHSEEIWYDTGADATEGVDIRRWGTLAVASAVMAYGVSRRSTGGYLMAAAAAVPVAIANMPEHWWPSPGQHANGDTREALSGSRGIHVRESVRVERPVSEVYRFWRRLENLPQFMSYLESVTPIGDGRTRWVAKGPAGREVTWDAEIINDVENQVIGWRSLPGADVVSAGSVNFDPVRGGRGTQVTVHLQYAPPAGRVGALVAQMFGREPSQTVREDLRKFKQVIEAGELARATSEDDMPGGRP